MNGVRISNRTRAYDGNNPVFAVGKRSFDLAKRYATDADRYNRIMSRAASMQERMVQNAKGNGFTEKARNMSYKGNSKG